MNALLVILNPRRIPECLEAFDALEMPRAWLTGFREDELNDVLQGMLTEVEGERFDQISVVSDDVVVTRQAFDAVLGLAGEDRVATGFCNLDTGANSHLVNITYSELGSRLLPMSYQFWTKAEVDGWPDHEPISSTFAGMCLTTMTPAMWRTFGLEAYPGPPSHGSDHKLSLKLQAAAIPIVAPKAGFCQHLKTTWNEMDGAAGRELYLGGKDKGVWLDL